MPMPEVGTQAYNDLVQEIGGIPNPEFNYEAHVAATRNADGTPRVIEKIPQQTVNANNDPVVNGPTPTPTNTSNFAVILTNPPAKMPSPGTVEYEQLLKETGGASANPGFSYEGHIQATRGASSGTILSDSNKTTTTPTQVQNGFTVILTNPPAKMPSPGTVEYEKLLKETGGASANPGFSYEGHIQATRGDSATWILNPDIPRPIEVDLSGLISKTTANGDALVGTISDDLIGTSKGAARLTGGEGADKFIFNQRDAFGVKGADTITDFNPEDGDQLIISPEALPGLTDTPAFESASSKKEFKTALKSDSDLIYYQPTGELFYDQNGSRKGFGKGGLFAVIDGAPALTAEDLGLL
ncbi:MAG: calcium-binding protein [Vulcanococcus sp.]|jgi:hypothetical protein|uniref:calcium-binding protein n=1 Tax=Vulcanococcus sp. TaxID=2856995 RepID=UPI0025E12A07|nr:calcium-binding protein [Vulcanococcus sp.]MBW0179456.1 calcium-binding protein [Vulcanococcus sp.]